jgi:copper chaperone CopZ
MMKRVTLLVAILVLFASAAAIADKLEKTLPDGNHQIALAVPDMECSMCTNSVSTELKHVSGVVDYKIDDVNRVILIKFNPQKTDLKRIQVAIKKAGFASHPVEATPPK